MAFGAVMDGLRIRHLGEIRSASEFSSIVDSVDHEGQVEFRIFGRHDVDVVAVGAGLVLGIPAAVADAADPIAVAGIAGARGHHVGAGVRKRGSGGRLPEVVMGVDRIGDNDIRIVVIPETEPRPQRDPDHIAGRRKGGFAAIVVFAGRRVDEGQGAERTGGKGGGAALVDPPVQAAPILLSSEPWRRSSSDTSTRSSYGSLVISMPTPSSSLRKK